jgi:hypothetical protein
VFHALPAPTDEAIATILEQVHDRLFGDGVGGARFLGHAPSATQQTPHPRLEGFSLHANVAVPAQARDALEHVCRYLLRPPLALERLTERSQDQLVYALPHPRRDGSTHLLLDPLELIEKFAVLIPTPRFHLLRFHGVLAVGHEQRSYSKFHFKIACRAATAARNRRALR